MWLSCSPLAHWHRRRVRPKGASPAPDGRAEASARFQRGVALFVEGDYDAALIEFRRAYDAAPAYSVLYDIGQTQLALRHYPEAIEAFSRYLSEGAERVTSERRAEVEATVATIRQRIGQVEVDVDVEGAEVRIDDTVVGVAPILRSIPVSIGTHRIEASARGRESASRTVTVAGGDSLAIHLSLPELAPVTVTVREVEESHPFQAAGTVGFVLAGLAGAAAVVTGVVALDHASSVDALLDQYPADPEAIDGARRETASFALATDVLIGGAVLIGGLSLTAFLLDQPSSHEAPTAGALRLTPSGVSLFF